MIEWSKMNERLPDMTPNRMLLDVNVQPKNKCNKKKDTTTSNFNNCGCCHGRDRMVFGITNPYAISGKEYNIMR